MSDLALTIGRDGELAAASSFLGVASTGTAALVVEGPPGIGKTTFLRAVSSLASTRGFQVLACRPVEAETTFSYAGLADLLEPVGGTVLDVVGEIQSAALSAALRPSAQEASVDANTVAAGLRSALAALAEMRPLLLVVDDAQWLDDSSAAALAYACRRLRRSPVGIVVSVRTPTSRALRLDVDRALDGSRVTHIELEPVTIAALHHILADRLDEPPHRPMLVRIYDASGGNPLLAIELARRIAASDHPIGPDEPLPVGGELSDLIASRIAALSPDARAFALVVAAVANPTVESVLDATDHNAWDGSPGPELEAAGVIAIRDGIATFTHPMLRSAAYAMASAPARRDVHRRLADHSNDPEVRARHLGAAAVAADPTVAAGLDEGAAWAFRRGAPAAAAELAERALELTPSEETGDRFRRMIGLAAYCIELGDGDRADVLLREAIDGGVRGEALAEALLGLARVRFDDGNAFATLELVRRARAEVELDTLVGLRAIYDLAWITLTTGDPTAAVQHATQGLAAAQALGDHDSTINLATVLLFAEFSAGLPMRPEVRALATAGMGGGGALEPAPGTATAAALAMSDEFELARKHYGLALRYAANRGTDREVALALVGWADMEWRTGDFSRALELAEEAIEVAANVGERFLPATMWFARARVRACIGDVDGARADAERGVREAIEAGALVAVAGCTAVLGFLEWSLGNATATHARLAPLYLVQRASGAAAPGLTIWVADDVEALVALGDFDLAREITDWHEEISTRAESASGRGRVHRCRSVIAAAQGDVDSALEHADAAVAIHETLPLPIELGRSLLIQGQVRRRARQKRSAREALERAHDAFTRLGMPLWLAKAGAELARVRPSREAASTAGALTGTERRCAELAAGGMRNREIAAELFISERTVVTNLTRAYSKLGITSRAQLATSLASQTA